MPDMAQYPVGAVLPRPILYEAKDLRRWRAAAGDALFSKPPIVCVGDSITFGQGGDNNPAVPSNIPDNTNGWVGQLRSLLGSSELTGASNPGEGYIFANDSRVTNEAGVFNNFCNGPLRNACRLKAGQKLKIIVPAGVKEIGIIQANMAKAFNEGGTKLADVTGASKLGAGAEVPLTALTNTNLPITTFIKVAEGEELQILGPGAAQTYIVGLLLLTEKNGIAVHRVGIAGYVSGDMLGGQKLGVLLQAASAENQQIAARALYKFTAAEVGLLIISFLANDQQFQLAGGNENERGVTKTLYREWHEQVAKQAVEDGWCVLLLGEPRSPSAAASPAVPPDEYLAGLKAFAERTDHVAFCDIGEYWGTPAESSEIGLTEINSVHPLRKGHGDIARMIYRLTQVNAVSGGIASKGTA